VVNCSPQLPRRKRNSALHTKAPAFS
jgi:hypothetical protein